MRTISSFKDLVDMDPHDFLDDVRSEGRCVWDADMQAWLLTRHEDCAFVLRREDLFAAPWPFLESNEQDLYGPRGLFLLSGREHQQIYRGIVKFFSPPVVRDYRDRLIRPIVARQIDNFRGQSRAELHSSFSSQVPIRVIAAILGIPWHDEDLTDRCWRIVSGLLDHVEKFTIPGEVTSTEADAVESVRQLNELVVPAVRQAAGEPDSYVAKLWAIGGSVFDDWSEDDVIDHSRFLFHAGSFTTASLISNSLYLVLTVNRLREEILRNPDKMVPRLIEESLRLFPPLQTRLRIALEDVSIGDTVLRRGDRVDAVLAAAGRDPTHYSSPCEVEFDRENPGDHLAFGKGPRFCAGAPLARVEGAEAIAALLKEFPDIQLDPEAPQPGPKGFLLTARRPLHVVLRER